MVPGTRGPVLLASVARIEMESGPAEIARLDRSRNVTLNVELEAVGAPDDDGIVTVMTVLNGQLRPVYVRDRSVTVDKPRAEKADASVPGHVAAPFAGAVTVKVAEGDTVAAGDPIATIEAMKMEAAITTSIAGTVERMALTGTTPVEAGDLIAVVRPA